VLRWSAFQGFSIEAAERAAIERANAAQERLEQAKIEIEYKIKNAWADYQTQSERLKTLPALALETEKVRQDFYAQWNDLGRRTLLEVLTAESEHMSVLLSITSAEVDRELALARVRFEGGELAEWIAAADATARSAP
jgi:adhesin transport system outer membrane protein